MAFFKTFGAFFIPSVPTKLLALAINMLEEMNLTT